MNEPTVGKTHKTHFSAPDIDLINNLDTGMEWVKVGMKFYLLPKKRRMVADEAEVIYDRSFSR